jgi:hypothetical protein
MTVLDNFLAGSAPRDASAMKRCGRAKSAAALPAIPEALGSSLACRNNRLLLAALAQIQPEIDAAIARHGAPRVAVVIGSSTSGIAEGEAALAEKLCNGTWSLDFRLSPARNRHGRRVCGALSRPHRRGDDGFYRLLLQRQSVGQRAAFIRIGFVRRGDLRRQ